MRPDVRKSVLFHTDSGVSVCTSANSFSNFVLIWCVGRPRPHMRTSMTSTRSKVKVKVKVMRLLIFENCTFIGLSPPPF